METPEVVAISTPDLHPLELYSVHTSLSFLHTRFSGRIAVVTLSLPIRSCCPSLSAFLYIPLVDPRFAVQILEPRLFSILCCTSRCTSHGCSSLPSRSQVWL
jgi:hypothetical protein